MTFEFCSCQVKIFQIFITNRMTGQQTFNNDIIFRFIAIRGIYFCFLFILPQKKGIINKNQLLKTCFRLFCRSGQRLEQTSGGSVTTFPVSVLNPALSNRLHETVHKVEGPPASLSPPSFVVRSAIVMGTQCCYWATAGRSLLIGWKDLKVKHVGNNQSGPADVAFNMSVNFQTCTADVYSPKQI